MQRTIATLALATVFSAVAFFETCANDAKENAAKGETTRVLFIGNSYTYFNDLNVVFQEMLNASGIPAEAPRATFGGWRLRQHFNGETPAKRTDAVPTLEVLRGTNWDYVVLQEQSCGIVDQRAEYFEYGKKLSDAIKENCPSTKVLLYQTWGRCDGMFEGYGEDEGRKSEVLAAFEARYSAPDESTIESLKDGIQGGCAKLASEIGAVVAPVGKAFQTVGDRVDLHADEGDAKPHHPSPAGTYLAACVFYKVVTGDSPVGLWKKLTEAGKDFKVGEEDAALLEQVANEVVSSN